MAVALKWLLPLVKQFGGTHPHEEVIHRDIVTLGIRDGKGIPNTLTSIQMVPVFQEGLVE